MLNLIFAVIILLEIITYIIIADVILSWLTLFWVNWRPVFISSILDPIYQKIKKILPTTIWPLDLTPIVVLLVIWVAESIIISMFPQVWGLMSLLK